jgi:hypothetical protein
VLRHIHGFRHIDTFGHLLPQGFKPLILSGLRFVYDLREFVRVDVRDEHIKCDPLETQTNWTMIYRHESICIRPQTLRSSENPRGKINDLCFLKHIPQALDKFPMRWVLVDIVIPIGGAVVLHYKGVGDATLTNSVF